MNDTNQSEVARLTSLIEAEYQATQRVFTEFTAQGRHAFITKRQENIDVYYQELQKFLPQQEAIAIIAQVSEAIQPPFSSSGNTS